VTGSTRCRSSFRSTLTATFERRPFPCRVQCCRSIRRTGTVALTDRWLRARLVGEDRLPLANVASVTVSLHGFGFPAEIIVLAARWYLRYGLSYCDIEELLCERGIEVDHVTVYRWVQRFSPLLADAAHFARHSPGDRWFVGETYVKSTACGATSTARSTSTGSSSTYSSRSVATATRHAGSSPAR
jgi:hypothetical protein